MNKIIIGSQGSEYADADILSVQGNVENAMVAETLAADTLSAVVAGDPVTKLCDVNGVELLDSSSVNIVTGEDLASFKFGDPLTYEHDNNIIGKFYIKQIQRTGVAQYSIDGVSTVGLLVYSKYNGGIYVGTPTDTVGSVIADIFTAAFGAVTKGQLTDGYYPYTCHSGLVYRVSAEVDSIAINGWLPIGTCRDSLQQVLFSCGASILKNDAGVLWFGFNQPSQATIVPDDRIYIGGSVDYKTQATKVSLVEHQYIGFTAVDEETLFDNSSELPATNMRVEFSEPIIVSTINVPSGMTVEAHPNYMMVSGRGVITGKPYTHLTRTISKSTGIVSEQNEMSAENATLISALNSENALERLASYYSIAQEISEGIVVEGERTGDLIRFTNLFGEQSSGIIKSMSFAGSRVLRANSVIATNWLPNHLGNNYDSYLLLTPDDWGDNQQTVITGGIWSAGALTGKKVRVVLFGGAHGGYGGYDGSGGQTGKYPQSTRTATLPEAYGGAGGYGGNGGQCGNVYQFDIESLASSYNLSFGSGGNGGARNGGAGSAGTDTTMTVNGSAISSALGGQYAGNYINLINGDMYADIGTVGIQGGKGGDETRFESYDVDHISTGETGEPVGAYNGGTGGSVVGYEYVSGSGNTTDVSRWGSGGGGAAYGANGNNGANGTVTSLSSVGNPATGGSGANASPSGQNIFGRGGYGGNGGGGGGAGGYNRRWRNGSTTDYVSGSGGAGGNGSVGGTGSKGFILIYYKA